MFLQNVSNVDKSYIQSYKQSKERFKNNSAEKFR